MAYVLKRRPSKKKKRGGLGKTSWEGSAPDGETPPIYEWDPPVVEDDTPVYVPPVTQPAPSPSPAPPPMFEPTTPYVPAPTYTPDPVYEVPGVSYQDPREPYMKPVVRRPDPIETPPIFIPPYVDDPYELPPVITPPPATTKPPVYSPPIVIFAPPSPDDPSMIYLRQQRAAFANKIKAAYNTGGLEAARQVIIDVRSEKGDISLMSLWVEAGMPEACFPFRPDPFNQIPWKTSVKDGVCKLATETPPIVILPDGKPGVVIPDENEESGIGAWVSKNWVTIGLVAGAYLLLRKK